MVSAHCFDLQTRRGSCSASRLQCAGGLGCIAVPLAVPLDWFALQCLSIAVRRRIRLHCSSLFQCGQTFGQTFGQNSRLQDAGGLGCIGLHCSALFCSWIGLHCSALFCLVALPSRRTSRQVRERRQLQANIVSDHAVMGSQK